ncbi:DsbA family protein [Brevibacterium aurantiacum]|uniref:Disulfide bond formation protein DsbA n=1 Tax=Brevibacterium aurantiacum TaxID=273384 RepID=A0A2A3ZQR3_BREAU|nr:thioredoxin domain-containing protein [Brevibacterium aurantiacum]AZL10440.1 disulfide bond formation protein DsbA [Brevibacterium aurantiacum]AZT98445.1 disulfide bond formation protein DsbA [Brevibacterium aurantiacum]PCC51423.1 disulfide bond formation protein DsbA [Brevibacterium aurantiacum]PCC53919.1 disulfide bond formation protein DsbA [Brevibacterium aurantiacum]RCS92878.1 disulfide bond formation protein DsbA [Brevibacterium aurantiacum]
MAKNNSGDNRRNQARENARQIAAAQAKKEKTAKTILYVGIGVVVVVVAAVVGVLIFQQSKPGITPANYVANGVSMAKDGEVVQPKQLPDGEESDLPTPAEAGAKKNAATVTVYLDFQCPGCKTFEEANTPTLEKLADEGSIVLEYKPVSILDRMSSGNEYSTRAANLAACVVDSQPETVRDFFPAMYAQQPEEQGNGRTDEELLKVAEEAGVDTSKKLTSDPEQTVESCVTDQSFKDFVEKSSKEALDSGVEATPWVLINGKQTDKTSDPQALTLEILKATGEFKG